MEDTLWTFGDLRAALQVTPSDDAWSHVVEAISAAHEARSDEVEQVWLPYAMAYLDRWDDKYRIMPSSWFKRLVEGDESYPLLPLVKTIYRQNGVVNDEMLSVLAQSPMLEHVTIVYLDRHRVSAEGLKTLFESPHLGQLQKLVIRHSRFDEALVDAFVSSECWQHLTSLRLSHCHLDDAGMDRLCRAGVLDGLEEAWFGHNALTTNGMLALTHCAPTRLKRLSVRNNLIGDDGLRALAALPWIGSLYTLELEHCDVGQLAWQLDALQSIRYLRL